MLYVAVVTCESCQLTQTCVLRSHEHHACSSTCDCYDEQKWAYQTLPYYATGYALSYMYSSGLVSEHQPLTALCFVQVIVLRELTTINF